MAPVETGSMGAIFFLPKNLRKANLIMTAKDAQNKIAAYISAEFGLCPCNPEMRKIQSSSAAYMITEMLISKLDVCFDPEPPEGSLHFWNDRGVFYSIQGTPELPTLWQWNANDRRWAIPSISAIDLMAVLRCILGYATAASRLASISE